MNDEVSFMKMIGFVLYLSTKNSIVKEEPWTDIFLLEIGDIRDQLLDYVYLTWKYHWLFRKFCSAKNNI